MREKLETLFLGPVKHVRGAWIFELIQGKKRWALTYKTMGEAREARKTLLEAENARHVGSHGLFDSIWELAKD